MKNRAKGFTLIEIMIAIVVVAILASLALPSYNNIISKGRRADAQAALMSFGQAMERHYTDTGSYAGAAGTVGTPTNTGSPWVFYTKSPHSSSVEFYNLTIEVGTAVAYTLKATPANGQAGDGRLDMTHTGARCWYEDYDGSGGTCASW